jgi:hypothetical protein
MGWDGMAWDIRYYTAGGYIYTYTCNISRVALIYSTHPPGRKDIAYLTCKRGKVGYGPWDGPWG